MSLNIVLQYQTAQGASGLILGRKAAERHNINTFLKWESEDRCALLLVSYTFRFEACEDKDEIVVEIWKLIKLFQFLQVLLRGSTMCAHKTDKAQAT